MEHFFSTYFEKKKKTKQQLSPQLLDELYKIPKKDKGLNIPHFNVLNPNLVHQADLLFMPNDHGFKYILVVADANNRITDAESLKNKSSYQVRDAFDKIYSRNILSLPEQKDDTNYSLKECNSYIF